MAEFSEEIVDLGDGQVNVQRPPDAIIKRGFLGASTNGRGMPLAAPWLNWILRELFRGLGLDRVTDASGTSLFPYINTVIRLDAIDRDDPNKFLHAIGYKGGTGVHVLKVINSAGLALGTPTLNGDQPVTGGVDVQVVGYSRKAGS